MKPLQSKVPPKLPVYVFKLLWRATSKTVKITAKNYDEALRRVESDAKKMEGWGGILEIKFIERRG